MTTKQPIAWKYDDETGVTSGANFIIFFNTCGLYEGSYSVRRRTADGWSNVDVCDTMYAAKAIAQTYHDLFTAQKPNKLQQQARLFLDGQIDKFAFYPATMSYSAKEIAAVTGIDIDIIRDRRSYMRALAR